ncbi:MAG: TIGR04086 family membrane protein [Lachnospiraceae bacterium]|nr:TIGR04086 family membrane protein [Lachnospiraceae bacterium]
MKVWKIFLKVLLAVYGFSAIMILALAGLAYKFQWRDTAIAVGVVVIYILANLLGGFIIGKVKEKQRFLWGALQGLIYFVVVSAISFILTRHFYDDGVGMLVSAAICTLAGMFGGMIS